MAIEYTIKANERFNEWVSYILTDSEYIYQFACPWVKNYYGERAAGNNEPGPAYALIWIDQPLKKEMGY